MMKSMTGFGKASVEDEAYRVNIEVSLQFLTIFFT